jgi:hypothetical protein
MASGAVLPWPGFTTAAAYTVMTSRKVMKTYMDTGQGHSMLKLKRSRLCMTAGVAKQSHRGLHDAATHNMYAARLL